MSIISEALKKARESRPDNGGASAALPPAGRPSAEAEVRRASRSRVPLFAALVFIAVAGPLCFPLVVKLIGGRDGSTGSPQGAVTQRGQFSIEERPLFRGSDRPVFALSGIAQFQESFMAVVNGHILKSGDEIQGAKVVTISADAVELEYRGERIVLEKTF